MSFTFAQPLKLLAIGGSLITTTSLWFFNPHAPSSPVQAIIPLQTSAKSTELDDDENINSFDSAEALTTRTGKLLEDERIKNPSLTQPNYISFSAENSVQKILSFYSVQEIQDFELKNVMGKRSQYKELKKTDIKIYLFKEHAFFSSTNYDEYESQPLEQDKIEELFDGLDETKTKQLLLSLQKNIEWALLGTANVNPTYYFGREVQLIETYSPNGLKNLKIKHFKEFKDLKAYVQEKVKGSCTEDKKACVAIPQELDTYKTDTQKYFNTQ